ncbi:hypothetical protein RB653_007384 [Dictyostelium firmibasis]|uniref:tRNA (guanine(46)-N(7))-methyltransferase n=1 Tax=Dictyostelium firmibasis TaxID=79012 RepID=A0AAN7U3L3_9MYCE
MMDLKRKFSNSLGATTPIGGIGSVGGSITKLIIKNIPKSIGKNEIIENLKKIIQNPSINITIPITLPPDLIGKVEADTTVSFLSSPNLSQLSTIKNLVNGKTIGDKKVIVEFYDVKKVIPIVTPIITQEESNKKIKLINQKPKEKKPKEKKQKTPTITTPATTSTTTNASTTNTTTTTTPITTTTTTTTTTITESTTNEQKKKNKKKNQKLNDKKVVDSEKEKEKEKEENKEIVEKIEEPKKEPTVRNNRAVINKITSQMSSCAEAKDYVQLVKAYNYLKKIGAKPDHITYGVMLNACVRCQEYKKAKEVFQDAVKDSNANDVVYTIYIKALCEVDMDEAFSVIKSMIETKPNIRTFNSIFRGCIRSGDIEITKSLILLMKANEIYPDSTTIEYLIKIYSHHLMVQDIWDLLGKVYERMQGQISPICFSRLSLASLLSGDIKSSVKALGITDDILSKAPRSTQTTHKNKGKLSEKNKISSSLFERINKQEINEESDRVRNYLSKLTESRSKIKYHNMESFNRIYFSKNTFKNNVNRSIDQQSKPVTVATSPDTTLASFNGLFNSYKKDGSNFNSNRMLKMEICSGHGHWVTERAGQDLDADWISLEIRYDRIFQIWSKMILEAIDNLYIVGGDAHGSLKEVVPDNILHEVYINYPNPPVWAGAERLINELFLVEINRCLKKDGTLTIVTDDKDYSDQIIETLSKSKKLQKIYKPVKETYLIQLSEDYGYSYFNKLWNNGQRVKRYCIYISKVVN